MKMRWLPFIVGGGTMASFSAVGVVDFVNV